MSDKFHIHFLSMILLSFIFILPKTLLAEDNDNQPPTTEFSFVTYDGNEINGYRYPAKGDTIVLWIGSGYNFSEKLFNTLHALSRQGIEIWQVDFAEALFIPKSSNFMRNLDARYVADMIHSAHKQSGKKVILMSRAYGAIPTMRGATLWQQQYPAQHYLAGAILFSPDFYSGIPELGQDPQYLPITRQTSLPLVIYQGGRRGTARQLPHLLEQIRSHNQNVYLKVMPDVSGVFYYNDHEAATLRMFNALPMELPKVMKLLQGIVPQSASGRYAQPSKKSNSRPDIKLRAFNSNPVPPSFTLHDIDGKQVSFHQPRGKIVIVNFWATWCPPCVEEIPSLNRLKEKMKDKPFELISINYAQPADVIQEFMQRIHVEYPVLLDINTKVAGEWNVFAFPSTFVIGPDGHIHYGVNAAILWDSDEVIETLNTLLQH